MVPGVLLFAELVAKLYPGLFYVWSMVLGPLVNQLVKGMDVLNHDLVTWIQVFAAVLVIHNVWLSSLMQAKVCCQSMPQSLSVTWC